MLSVSKKIYRCVIFSTYNVLNSGFFAQNLKEFEIINKVGFPEKYCERNL